MGAIETLPAEIIDLIVAGVDYRTLPKLRLTCRALSSAPNARLFRSIEIWLEASSLQRLLNIAMNPRLSKHVKTLTCGIEQFYDVDFGTFARYVYHEDPDDVEDINKLSKKEKRRRYAAYNVYRDHFNKQKELWHGTLTPIDKQTGSKTRGTASQCIQTAFSSFTALRSIDIIDYGSVWWMQRCDNQCGYTRANRGLLQTQPLLQDHMLTMENVPFTLPRGAYQLQTIFGALAKTARYIEEFNISLWAGNLNDESFFSALNGIPEDTTSRVFSELKKVTIDLPELPVPLNRLSAEGKPSICTILQAPTKLQSLYLALADGDLESRHPPRFRDLCGNRKIGNLQTLYIDSAVFYTSDFTKFLLRSCLGLREFGLTNASLKQGPWDPIFNVIRQMNCLEKIELSDLQVNSTDDTGEYERTILTGEYWMDPQPLYDYLLKKTDVNPVARMIEEDEARDDEMDALYVQDEVLEVTLRLRQL